MDVQVSDIETVVGDMPDTGPAAAAPRVCDAVVHAATAIGATVPAGSRPHADLARTRDVAGGAVAQGGRAVYVSAAGVLVPPSAPVTTADAPLARPRAGGGWPGTAT
ncbi:hypothetical protein [Actinomadura sp. NEAU-AAG7]|uniref:hypothetical protein n=1 Tax=Actinomadura sp. NEAU-AAG7 TaxID=2839640 RepID=UPI001BE4A5AF|nr:hypothetical protein [Actinomadura sp. NEAU-AAG7]MBT2211451.1 hypothetical protein [Actinomadura sp. NEAU-AAG7]